MTTTYTVIGIYGDDHSRFSDNFEAETPDKAEEMAVQQHPGLIVAGVLNPEGQLVG